MSIFTGRQLRCYIWEENTIDYDVIFQVEELSAEKYQPIIKDGYPIFECGPGKTFLDDM